ncbi:MAG: biotin/lipoyl-containing protein, partial [Sphingomonadaceae bacterium]
MALEIKLPAMSPTMEEGTLARWLVAEGEAVKAGQVLAEIETDKATMELEADTPGTVARLLVPGGTDGVKVGTPIALIAEEGEDAAEVAAGGAPAPAPAPAPAAPAPAAPAPAAPASASPAPAAPVPAAPAAPVAAAPAVAAPA